MTTFIFIFIATMIYNILNGMASILIAKGLITSGAFFDALRNIMNILILSFVILQVKDNYYLLIPLFLGYFTGMVISGYIINYLKLGEITISAFVDGDKHTARVFAETLSQHNIMNTSFIGTGSKSKTVMVLIITNRKSQDKTIKYVKQLVKSLDLPVKLTVSDTSEWRA